MARTKIRDVAQEAGVSVATVSLVLNDAPARISDETRRRVREAAERMHYRPNATARGLRTRRSRTVGVVSVGIVSTPFAGRMIAGLQDVARERGYLVFLADTDDDPDTEAAAIRAYSDQQVETMIYASMFHKVVEPPKGLAPGAVFLDCRPADGGSPAVVPDDLGGGRAATQELIDAGHERIAYVDADEAPRPAAAELRFQGHLEALAAAGIAARPELHLAAEVSGQGGRHAIETLWALPEPDRPTAIFFFNDRQAAGAYLAAHRLGVDIPADLSVVGYDDQQFVAAEQDPPLTTIALPHYEMGRWAMETALGFGATPSGPGQTHLMPCPLIRRASVGPPPTRSTGRRRSAL
ncbi:MAG: LacI family DNA-binding transcriptional regulator [Propionibacteriaceae bacterium]|jgi:LacI family transcriptional regulator|nr:LacI family DNA-binding transcriptional regulator [Propionibacteriaceae bacterium]